MEEKSFVKFHWEFVNQLEEEDCIMVIEMRENEKGFIYPEDLGISVEEIVEKIKKCEDEDELYDYLYWDGTVDWM